MYSSATSRNMEFDCDIGMGADNFERSQPLSIQTKSLSPGQARSKNANHDDIVLSYDFIGLEILNIVNCIPGT